MIKDFGLDYSIHLILMIFAGILWGAVIRISRGNTLMGVLYFLTGGFFLIGWLIDFVNLLTKKNFAV